MARKIALVVDDDDAIRRYISSLLKIEGFQVREASDGVAALAALRECGASIQVVITDIRMPGADGVAFYESAADERPDLPFLFITGYADSERMVSIPGRYPVITKPFTSDALLSCVRSVLGIPAGDTNPIRVGKGSVRESSLVYLCECGKKWTFPHATPPSIRKCECGISIRVEDGTVFGCS
jgi:DNA-binding NtrC family response regulator